MSSVIDKRWESIVRPIFDELVQGLNPISFLDRLYREKLVENEEYQLLLAISTSQGQSRKLLSILPRKGPTSYDRFMTILGETQGQEHVFEALCEQGKTCKTCNVLLMGAVGTGKSTIAKKLCREEEGDKSFFRLEPKLRRRTLTDGDNQYNLKVIDPIAVFHSSDLSLAGKNLKKVVLKECPEGLTLIVLVLKKRRFSEAEHQFLRFIQKNAGQEYTDIFAIVISNCEDMDDETKRKFIAEFRSHETTRPFARMAKAGIVAVGFPDLSRLKPMLKQLMIEETEEGVKAFENLCKRNCKLRSSAKELLTKILGSPYLFC